MTTDEQGRYDALVNRLRQRLGPVCIGWPETLFDQMINQLAEITIKYESDQGIGIYDRRGTDRMIAEMKKLLERNQALRMPPAIPPIPPIERDDTIEA